jgi:hypothetical protein
MPSSLHHATALVFASVLSTHISAAQSAPPRDEPAVCLGFSFGRWTPPLEWSAAGHGPRPDTSRLQRTVAGRDWATRSPSSERDSLLILFPSWWPAGVAVELPTRTPAPGDTIVGQARAFVADGRVQIPTSRVRAWRVAC